MKDLVAGLQRQVTSLRAEMRTKPITTARAASLPPSAVIDTAKQTAHGFSVGQVVRMTNTGAYALAKADTATNALAVGVVAFVQNANTFSIITGGYIGGLSGLTAGAAYYLSSTVAGALTTTPPTIAVSVFIAISAKVAIIDISSPNAVSTGALSALTAQIHEPSHGFVLGNIVGSTPAGLWFKVTADNYADLNAMAIVSTVIDSNNVILTFEGLALGVLSGISLGVRYYLDPTTPGAVTPIKPMGNSVQVFTCANGTAGGSDGTDVIIHPFHAMGFANDTGLVVHQSGHGFQIGSALIVDNTGVYQLAQASSLIDANVIGLVGEVRDVDHFTLVSEGFIPNPTSGPGLVGAPFTPGIPYYLDTTTPGSNTSSEPVAFATKLFTYIDTLGIYIQIEHASDFPDAIGFAVHEPGHGFAVGTVLRISGADTYTEAKADIAATAKVVGIVGAVLGVDDFFLITSGRVSGLTSIIDGTKYYLSDTVAGAVTTTPPKDNVVEIYEGIDTTKVIVNIRPVPTVTYISQIVHQVGHSFAVGDVLCNNGVGTYTKAQADTATNALALGVVSQVLGSDDFILTMAGLISGLAGLTTGAPYYLDATTAGAVNVTAPGSNVVTIYEAISTTQAIVKIVKSTDSSFYKSATSFSSGSGTWAVPAGVTRVRVVLIGGGASGAGGETTPLALVSGLTGSRLGGAGGSGGYLIVEINVTPGDVISYSVGTGGAGVTTATNGNDGVDTTVTFSGRTLKAGKGLKGIFATCKGGDGGTNVVTWSGAITLISLASNGQSGGIAVFGSNAVASGVARGGRVSGSDFAGVGAFTGAGSDGGTYGGVSSTAKDGYVQFQY